MSQSLLRLYGLQHRLPFPLSSQLSSAVPVAAPRLPGISRCFSNSTTKHSWLAPRRGHSAPNRKGRPRVHTGGSVRGTTVVWGDYGIRMRDHDRRISAAALDLGMKTIRQRLRGERYRIYTRVCANIGVYTSGNEVRMGKGKGKFDYWAARGTSQSNHLRNQRRSPRANRQRCIQVGRTQDAR